MQNPQRNVSRGVIVARIKPGSQEAVARIFAESDEGDLPQIAGVRHRSLYAFGDVYIHLVEIDGAVGERVESVRHHPLFREISERLAAYIEPYDPSTWRSPKDATATEFYCWDAPG
jgi:cyclase